MSLFQGPPSSLLSRYYITGRRRNGIAVFSDLLRPHNDSLHLTARDHTGHENLLYLYRHLSEDTRLAFEQWVARHVAAESQGASKQQQLLKQNTVMAKALQQRAHQLLSPEYVTSFRHFKLLNEGLWLAEKKRIEKRPKRERGDADETKFFSALWEKQRSSFCDEQLRILQSRRDLLEAEDQERGEEQIQLHKVARAEGKHALKISRRLLDDVRTSRPIEVSSSAGADTNEAKLRQALLPSVKCVIAAEKAAADAMAVLKRTRYLLLRRAQCFVSLSKLRAQLDASRGLKVVIKLPGRVPKAAMKLTRRSAKAVMELTRRVGEADARHQHWRTLTSQTERGGAPELEQLANAAAQAAAAEVRNVEDALFDARKALSPNVLDRVGRDLLERAQESAAAAREASAQVAAKLKSAGAAERPEGRLRDHSDSDDDAAESKSEVLATPAPLE
jgi:hypothetical protein